MSEYCTLGQFLGQYWSRTGKHVYRTGKHLKQKLMCWYVPVYSEFLRVFIKISRYNKNFLNLKTAYMKGLEKCFQKPLKVSQNFKKITPKITKNLIFFSDFLCFIFAITNLKSIYTANLYKPLNRT